jgi:hypothetical protein
VFSVQYVHMSNSTQVLGNTSVLAETKQPACHLVPAVPPLPDGELRELASPLRTIVARPDTLTAQRVEVGIVLNAMLGRAAAVEYLSKHSVSNCVMQRVLSPMGQRRGNHDASGIRT